MNENPVRYSHLPPSLRSARRLIVVAFLVCLLLVAGMTANGFLCASDSAAVAWMRRLDLSMPALWPAGTLERAPEIASPAVLLRLSPRDGDPWNETRIANAWHMCPGPKVTP